MSMKALMKSLMDDLDDLFEEEGFAKKNPDIFLRYASLDAERDNLCVYADSVYGTDENDEPCQCPDCRAEREESEKKILKN